MLPPLPPTGFEYFRMPLGFEMLEKVRDAIGLERLYFCLTRHGLLSYHHTDSGGAGGLDPHYWDTPEGRDVLSSSGVVQVRGERSLVIVAVPYALIRSLEVQAGAGDDKVQSEPAVAPSSSKPISEADMRKAIELLRAKTMTERMTKAERRDFLRRAFPDRHFTEDKFRRVEREVPAKLGRPAKCDE